MTYVGRNVRAAQSDYQEMNAAIPAEPEKNTKLIVWSLESSPITATLDDDEQWLSNRHGE